MRLHVRSCAHGGGSPHNKRSAQVKVLLSLLTIAPSLRSAVMPLSFVITNHKLIERHPSVIGWECFLRSLHTPLNRPLRFAFSKPVDAPNQYRPLRTAPTGRCLARRSAVDNFEAVV